MTRIQLMYYRTVRDFVSSKGYFPQFREISEILGGKSFATIHMAMNRLVARGLLTKEGRQYTLVPDKMHGLESCGKGHPVIWFLTARCPLCDTLSRIPKV